MTRNLHRSPLGLWLAVGFSILSLAALVGCGSDLGGLPTAPEGGAVGPDGVGDGGLTFTVRFPEASAELIPAATQSIKVVVKRGTTVLAERILTKASPTTTITGITAGWTVVNTVTAHASTDGTGTALASGQTSTAIRNGVNANVTITLKSTITRVTLTPAATAVSAGASVTLVPTAYDRTGAVVLTSAATWQFTSSNAALFPVTSGGVVTANGTGTASITAKETESLKVARATVGVGALSISPTSAMLQNGAFARSLTITNTGAGTMQWTATPSHSWLKVSQASGSGNATIEVVADRTGLAPGQYTGVVTVASSCGTAELDVTFDVGSVSDTAGPYVAWCTQAGTDRNIAVKRYDGTGGTVLLTTGTTYRDTAPSISADGSTVAWVSSKDPLGDVYVGSASGGTPIRISNSALADTAPALSGDGAKVAWVSKRSGNNEIYVASTSGTESGVVRISNAPTDDLAPCLNADGSKVAWVSRRNGAADIYIASTTGTEVSMVRVTSSTGQDLDPSLSADGSLVAFVTSRWGGYHLALASTAGTESGVTRLTAQGTSNLEPSLSADGSLVAFSSNRKGVSQVFVAATSGTDAGPWNPQPSTYATVQPSLSPDGAFVTWRSNISGNTEIWATPVGTWAPINLSQNATGDDSTPSAG